MAMPSILTTHNSLHQQLIPALSSPNLCKNIDQRVVLNSRLLYSAFRGVPLALRKESNSGYHKTSSVQLRIVADGGRQSWDIGRFLRTVYFFNGPPSFAKLLESLVSSFKGSPEKSLEAEDKSDMDLVLVTGATGGVGKRVVELLKKKGYPVRILVRNAEKAKRLLGENVDMVVADVTKKSTLLPEYFEGVKMVVNAVSVIVGPKEGDTAERSKYNQGIKFFEPEIKGDSPEAVEYNGMKNLIEAVRDFVGLRDGILLFSVSENGLPIGPAWGELDDVVMGGVSQSTFQIRSDIEEHPVALFKGVVSTDNNGGFASIRTKNFDHPKNLSAYEGLEIRLKGNGRRFKLIVRTSAEWDALGYTAIFDTVKDQWQSIRLPFSSFRPIFRARTVPDAPPFPTSKVMSLQIMYSKFEYDGRLNPTFEAGPFELPVASIRAYLKEPITPRFVHVSSAGVTRPNRPGLDLSKQPPAVRMNKDLGYILDFKLKGEDLLRNSGIPYSIIRPCALTEEPGGAELIFEQGDNITGKISREDVAEICIAAFESPSTTDTTFEVKCTLPFSEVFTIDPNNPPPNRDLPKYFSQLKKGITGKEALEKASVSV